MASGDRNGGLIVSDAQTGNENFDLVGHKEMITSVDWRVDGKILGSVSKDKSVRIWEMKKGKQVKTWGADGKGLTKICFLPQGNLLTAGRGKNVKLWQQDGKQLQTFNGLTDMAMGLAYCASTERIVAGSFTGEVLVWDRQNPESVGQLNSNPPPISERIVDVMQQLSVARQNFNADQIKIQNHDVTIDQVSAEVIEVEDKFSDMQKKVSDAKAKIAATEQANQIAKAQLNELDALLSKENGNDGGNGKAKPNQQRKQLKARRRMIKELRQQLTVLNNQTVAWDGVTATAQSRIADLQNEKGRLNDLRKPMVDQLETSRAEVARLEGVLNFWKSEAEYARPADAR